MKQLILLLAGIILCLSNAIAQQHPDPAPDANSDYEQRARQALERITQEQIEKISDTANSTKSGDEHNIKGYVLSTHIRTFSDIPKNIDNEIKEIKEQARLLIRTVATDIEINGGKSGTLSIDKDGKVQYTPNPSLPEELNKKREKLLKAKLDNNVSIRSAAMALHLLVGINDSLKEQATKATSRQEKEKVFMKQAIFVYEMADITLELLNGLTLEGKNIIEDLHKDAQERVETRIADIEKQKKEARKLKDQELMSEEDYTNELHTYDLMEEANRRSLDAWKKVIEQMGTQEKFILNLQKKTALIRYKRDKAKVQLETLRDLRQIAELRDSIGSLDDLVTSIADLDLLRLDEDTVSDLLGYGVKNDPSRD
ncbi:MAG: hypothetical protein SD837_20740 [Candidatus Electrothrix scaldis]|nr:MAG: hypothetical protein SD837_20740 [Candidatus Electrothrix sp. GW3-3]